MVDSLLSGDLGNMVVPAVMDGISNTRGEAFFHAITQRMSLAVDADFLLIGRLEEGNTRARTISVYQDQQRIDNFVYDLLGTPCERVSCEDAGLYRTGIQAAFPNDKMLADMGIDGYYGAPLNRSDGQTFGLIVAMYKRPVPDPERVASIFNLFAGRIAAEIESTENTVALEALNRALEERVAERTRALEAAKLQAESADQAKTVFLACMSHEIRTPLNGVLGMAELLENTSLTSQQSEYLHALRESGSSLLSIVNDVLDYTRIFNGDIDFTPATFELEDWLHSVITPFFTKKPDAVKLSVNVDEAATGLYRSDKDRLQQVLNNLLGNAMKFTSSGSIEVTVTKQAEEGTNRQLRFSVIDTGVGVPTTELDRIFDPFMQADATMTRRYGGTGLGLAISKHIVASLGGMIGVESVEGRGSTFYFTVPLEVESSGDTSLASDGEENQYPGIQVLLVEDNPVNQFLTVTQLEQLGVATDVVNDGREAVERLCEQGHQYDLVLMDCEMPVMDGFEATRTIRHWEAQQGRQPMAIYALTAHVLAENNEACATAGMDGRLTKPIRINDYYPVLDEISRAVAARERG